MLFFIQNSFLLAVYGCYFISFYSLVLFMKIVKLFDSSAFVSNALF
jgi:hypothetical protein